MDLIDIACPTCGRKGCLISSQYLKTINSEKSITGQFIIPASKPFIHCRVCDIYYKYISFDIENDKLLDFEILPEEELNIYIFN